MASVVTTVTPKVSVQFYATPPDILAAPLGQVEIFTGDTTVAATGVGDRAVILNEVSLPNQFVYAFAEFSAQVRTLGASNSWLFGASRLRIDYENAAGPLWKLIEASSTTAFLTDGDYWTWLHTMRTPPKGIFRPTRGLSVRFQHLVAATATNTAETFYRMQALFYFYDKRAGESVANTKPMLMR